MSPEPPEYAVTQLLGVNGGLGADTMLKIGVSMFVLRVGFVVCALFVEFLKNIW